VIPVDLETKLLTLALLLMLAAFPVTSIGTMEDLPVVWWIGIALILAGALIGPVMRYALPENGEAEENGGDGGNNGGNKDEPGGDQP
jgi:hypothetical protein